MHRAITHPRRGALALLVCLAATPAAGCGSSSSSSSGSSASSSATSSAAPASSSAATSTSAGTGRSAYIAQLKRVVAPWQIAGRNFETSYGKAVQAHDKAGTIKSIEDFKLANDNFANSLGALTPPGNAKPDQDRVVGAVRKLSTDLEQLKTAFSNTDAQLLARLQPAIQQDTVAVVTDAGLLGRAIGK